MMAWGAVLVMIMALWIPLVWLAEPSANAQDQATINADYVAAGRDCSTQLSTKDNPAGFGCVRCHGADLHGGYNYFNGTIVPVPDLQTVCAGPNGTRRTRRSRAWRTS